MNRIKEKTEVGTIEDDDGLLFQRENDLWARASVFATYFKSKIGDATSSISGLMSASDKGKLDKYFTPDGSPVYQNKFLKTTADGLGVEVSALPAIVGDLQSTNNLSDVDDAATSFNNIKQPASETQQGVVERATQAEVNAGIDQERYITPDVLEDKTLGTYLGSIISDDPTLKQALQELETEVETKGTGNGDLQSTNNLSDVDDAATSFNNIKQPATDSATGVVELATQAEVDGSGGGNQAVTLSTRNENRILITPADIRPTGDSEQASDLVYAATVSTNVTSNADELFFSVYIPAGKKVTDVIVYGDNTRPVSVARVDITTGTRSLETTGNVGTSIDLSAGAGDIESSSITYLVCEINTNNTNQDIYGAVITLADI